MVSKGWSDRLGEAVERLVDLRPTVQLLHVAEPALDIGIGGEVAADDLAQGQDAGAEIVRDGDLVAAQIGLGSDPVVVQELEPNQRALLAPGEGRGLRLVAAALVVREQLRVGQVVAEVAIEVGVEPVHHLVDLGPPLQVLGIGGGIDLVGEVFEDRRALGQAQIAVFEHRYQAVRVDRGERLLLVLAGHQVDDLLVHVDAVLGDEQAHRPARDRDRMHVEFHEPLPESSDRSIAPRKSSTSHTGYKWSRELWWSRHTCARRQPRIASGSHIAICGKNTTSRRPIACRAMNGSRERKISLSDMSGGATDFR